MDQGYWVVIPAEMVQGNPTKALLYGIIGSYCNSSGVCFASNATLAKKLGLETGGRLRQYLTELENDGWIYIEDRGGKNRKIYLSERFQPATKKRQPATKVAGQPATKSTQSNISMSKISKREDCENEFSQPSEVQVVQDQEQILKDKTSRFIQEVKEVMQGERLTESMVGRLKEFVSYWTEPTKGRKKIRWELQPTWDMRRRIATWMAKEERWRGSSSGGGAKYQATMVQVKK